MTSFEMTLAERQELEELRVALGHRTIASVLRLAVKRLAAENLATEAEAPSEKDVAA